MKKVILFMCMLVVVVTTNAQKLIVTPTGLMDSTTKNSYIVIQMDSLQSSQLYDRTIIYINKNYVNPEFVLRGNVKNDFISFKSHSDNIFTIKNGWDEYYVDVTYFVSLSFKNNKIKIEFSNIDMTAGKCGDITYTRYSGLQAWGTYVYKPDGELKDLKLKLNIEKFFNDEIQKIKNGIQKQENNNNW